MKRRLLLISISALLLILCAAGAVGCFSSGESGENGRKAPKSMDVETHSAHYDVEEGCFLFTYGEEVLLTKSDFTVKINYDDGTSETTDNYSLNASGGNFPDAGTHWLSISYRSGSASYDKSYKIAVGRAQYEIDVLDEISVTYTGEDIDLLAAADAELKAAGKKTLSEQVAAGFICVNWINNAQYVKDAGTYEVCAQAVKNYVSETAKIKVTVRKAVVDAPRILNGEITFDGAAHSPQFSFAEGTENLIEIKNATFPSAPVTSGYTAAGTYTYVAKPKDGNVVFANGKTEVVLTMTILPAALPYTESGLKLLRAEYPFRAGGYYEPRDIETNLNGDIFALSFTVSANRVSVPGDYTLIASPKGDYVYSDGKKVAPLSFRFTITPLKTDYSERYDEIAAALQIDTTFTPDTKVSDFLEGYLDDGAFIKKVRKAVTGSEYGYCSLRKIDVEDMLAAGTARYFIDFRHAAVGYDYSPIPVTLNVEKASLSARCEFVAADGNPFVYDKNAHGYVAVLTGENASMCSVKYSTYSDGKPVEQAIDAGGYVTKAEISLLPEYEKNYSLTVSGATEFGWTIERQPVTLRSSDFELTNARLMFEPSEKLQVNVRLIRHNDVAAIDEVSLTCDKVAADGVLAAGKYTASAKLKAVNGNYSLPTSVFTFSWSVLDTEVDLSGLKWNVASDAEFTYGQEITPRLINVPSYVSVSYRSLNGNPHSGVLNAGKHTVYADCEINQNVPNAERARITASPSPVTFKVNRAAIADGDFKCVYRIKYNQSFNGGNYGAYADYDETKKVRYSLSSEWCMFEVAGKQNVPDFDVEYAIVSANSSIITAGADGIKFRGTGVVTFTAKIKLKSNLNYYLENASDADGSITLTFTAEVYR